ncbi:NRDE-2, necessary for RNA interference-domain-containing protein [Clohesyomyces aquaticus]|uniref:NRDE-2, necessary for RNA interference-domain-containing protein n=1 Tax=Clohesyomyces aquaticus TaxID=1231657 RepID=A0A1Y1ZT69_9PLEO|nr:NRDE-2, necessary for RNA interference-domain-containing protein [Clohesyomyces aquaticus]
MSDVPKFASFRPKPKALEASSKAPETREKTLQSDRPPKDNALRTKSTKERTSKTAPSKRKRSPTPEREHARSYFVDRKGDPANLKYGSLDQRRVPQYRRYGGGYVLGIAGDRKIDRDLTTEKAMVLTPLTSSRRRERVLTSKHAFKDDSRPTRFVKVKVDSEANQGDALDYMSLTGTKKRKISVSSRLPASRTEAEYRSTEHQSDSEAPSDPDAEYESSPDENGIHPEIIKKNSDLTQKTRQDPTNIQVWLDLADHQEAMMSLGRTDPSTRLSVSDLRHLSDIKISIYEEGLMKAGSSHESQLQLQTLLMTEAAKYWARDKLAKKWEEMMGQYSYSAELWTKYLDFVQTSFVSFKYEYCRKAYNKCLKILQSSKTIVALEDLLYIIIRVTSMIQQAGYQELSMAIWQALLEFHLMQPRSVSDDESRLSQFEEFWESEVARIGENNALGWRNSDIYGDPYVSNLRYTKSSAPNFETFATQEAESIEKLKYAGRTTDDVGEDDPFHTILYSDIEDYLPCLPCDTPPVLLVNAFLCFCQLPPLPRVRSDLQARWLDPFLQRSSLHASKTPNEDATPFSQNLDRFRDCSVSSCQPSVDLLLDQGACKVFETFEHTDAAFIQRALKLLATDTGSDEALGEYLLAFELKYFPSEVLKTAKRLLRARPTSFRLYNAYGLVESTLGNSKRADEVFRIALSMNKASTQFTAPGSLQLFHSWVWEALDREGKSVALWRLISPQGVLEESSTAKNQQPDQSALLRARTMFTDMKDGSLLSRDYESAVLHASLLALLTYLSSKANPTPALAIHDDLSNWFAARELSRSSTAELHAQSIARLVAYHAMTTPIIKPSFLRTVLEPLLALFPSNTILLSLYASNEARFPIDDRVRSIMRNESLGWSKQSSIAAWFFAINFEMRRSEVSGSTGHSVRATFKRAEEDIGAYCPGLWKSHVIFELEQVGKEKRRLMGRPRRDGKKSKREVLVEEVEKRVKDTFFQGLTHLPWCKDYMMLAFTHLRGFLTDEELRKMYHVLVEKELRVYVELEESEA